MKNIPSDEEFAKADEYMEKLDSNIEKVNENSLQYFNEICPIHSHNFYLIAEEQMKFRAYVFYKKDKDIQVNKDNGVSNKVEKFVYKELERLGRGEKGEVFVVFEFDSDENVNTNYEGDYYLRMR